MIPNWALSMEQDVVFYLQRRYTERNYFDLPGFYLIWFGMQFPSSLTHSLDTEI